MCDVRCCVTVDYRPIGNGKIANQIHGFKIDYGKFILILDIAEILIWQFVLISFFANQALSLKIKEGKVLQIKSAINQSKLIFLIKFRGTAIQKLSVLGPFKPLYNYLHLAKARTLNPSGAEMCCWLEIPYNIPINCLLLSCPPA